MSTTTGGSPGTASDSGLVPIAGSRPPNGTTSASACDMSSPAMPASAARSTYQDAAPKCAERRTETMPAPASRASSTASSTPTRIRRT
jgi:hypothetical protein